MTLKLLAATAAAAAVTFGTATLVATAQSFTPGGAPARKMPIQIHLLPQNNSGESGTATLLDGTNGLIVKLRLANTTAPVQPAHIHKGTCDKLDPKPAYPLNTVRDGMSQTTVPGVTIAELQKAPFAINVHKSATEVPIYVSCGNVSAPK